VGDHRFGPKGEYRNDSSLKMGETEKWAGEESSPRSSVEAPEKEVSGKEKGNDVALLLAKITGDANQGRLKGNARNATVAHKEKKPAGIQNRKQTLYLTESGRSGGPGKERKGEKDSARKPQKKRGKRRTD